jgi:hypothetical protein
VKNVQCTPISLDSISKSATQRHITAATANGLSYVGTCWCEVKWEYTEHFSHVTHFFLNNKRAYGSFENIKERLHLKKGTMHSKMFATLSCVRLSVGPTVRANVGKDQRGMMGIPWFFFHTWQTCCKWYMRVKKLRKYSGGPAIIYGSHTNQSVRNAKSTPASRGYVRADAKCQRGMMGVPWIFSRVINVLQITYVHMSASKTVERACTFLRLPYAPICSQR